MSEVKLDMDLLAVEVYREKEPQERKGHVDIRVRLTKGFNSDYLEEVVTAQDIRVYFTTEDVSVKALIDSAFQQARKSVVKTLELWKSDPDPECPEGLWFE